MKTTFVPKFHLIFYIYSCNHSLLHFWLYLRYTNKSTFGLYILSCNTFISILYLLLITIHRPAFGLTLDINKEKYTKLSVVLFPVVLRVANFLLALFCSVVFLLCRKPVARILHQLCKVLLLLRLAIQWSCSFLLFLVCIKLLGNVVRVYPRIVQGLTFLLT